MASPATFPGKPKVESITYATEYRMTLPGRVYSAEDPLGPYSTTVVDYRGAQQGALPRVEGRIAGLSARIHHARSR
jgi:hypothetical protein